METVTQIQVVWELKRADVGGDTSFKRGISAHSRND